MELSLGMVAELHEKCAEYLFSHSLLASDNTKYFPQKKHPVYIASSALIYLP